MPEEIETQPEEIIKEKPKTGFLEKIKIHKWKILVGILGLFVFAGAVFGAYKFGQIQQERKRARSRLEQIELTRCEQDSDCVVAIRLDTCCSCPEAVSRKALEKDKNLVEYEFGKHYPPFPSKGECRNVACAPCAFWNETSPSTEDFDGELSRTAGGFLPILEGKIRLRRKVSYACIATPPSAELRLIPRHGGLGYSA